MNKLRYLQSYELLTVSLSFYRTNEINADDFLAKIAFDLDNHFSCDDFSLILHHDKQSRNKKKGIEENLFIDFSHIELQFCNLQILNFNEKLILYACALNWCHKFNFNISKVEILKRILSINEELSFLLETFFSDSDYTEIPGHNDIFILKSKQDSDDELEGDWIEINKPDNEEIENHYIIRSLPFPIKILYVYASKIFMISCPKCESSLSKNWQLSAFGLEFIGPGDSIQVNKKIVIDYYDLKSRYLRQNCLQKLNLKINDLSFSYPNGKGIRSFNLSAEPGTLSGVIGVEGSGKSTFLRLLAGEIVGTSGDIFINGYSLKKELYLLKGMIGFVPEDDLLFNELTVYENLYIPAKLYLGKTTSDAIKSKVDKLLQELGLEHVKNTIVGSVKDKNLLPGQRRLINIALELLRDPPILIVDNALTPLSQSDSSRIIEVLSNYSYKGKIVFTSITQTDIDTFAYFDRLFVLDNGGFPVYYGKIKDAWNYFCKLFKIPVTQHEKIGPESINHLIITKRDGTAKNSIYRYFTPLDLYNNNKELTHKEEYNNNTWKLLPENLLHPPTLDRQYLMFSMRNFKTKIARSRELIYTILVAPVLAILISIALRHSTDADYNFSTNENIPAFFFISILFAILFGLIQSANEIFKERNIIKKQEYLNLSRFSYINSKITYLFIIGLIQSFFYLLIANVILEITDMLLINWLILFSSFSFGILIGLMLSKTHRTLENIYARSIPLIIILQLLFGGGFIDIELNRAGGKNYTMLFSDLIVARWGYEAAMVYQFRYNSYQKNFYDLERDYALSEVTTIHLLPVLNTQLAYYRDHYIVESDTLQSLLYSIKYNLDLLASNHDIFPYENLQQLTFEEFDEELADDAMEYLEYLEFYFSDLMSSAKDDIFQIKKHISDSLGADYLSNLKSVHYNYAIAEEVSMKNLSDPLKYYHGIPLQVNYPIYQYPRSDLGRAQMYLPEKQLSGERVNTVEFNISIIWLLNLLLYIILIINIKVK
jgi:ABC-type multidrug transport system ATPase subunit